MKQDTYSRNQARGAIMPLDEVIPCHWLGYELGLQPPKVTRLGLAKINPHGVKEDIGFTIPKDKAPPPVVKSPTERPGSRTSAFRMVNFKTRAQYRITIDEDMARLRHSLPRRAGALKPQTVREIQELILVEPGDPIPSVIGEDTRIRIEPTTVFPYSAIAHLSNIICSGALIADNVVLTAAHCVVNGGIGQDPGYEEIWSEFTVIPAMDRDPSCNSGDSDLSCRLMPFGEIGVEWAMVPEGWLTPKGAPGGIYIYDPYDWVDDIAVVCLQEPVGQQTGIFDYRALNAEQLEHAAFLNRGYPTPFTSAISPTTPPGYEPWQMWGDQNYCLVEGFLGEVDGIHRIFRHECDTSPGHSGSPIYQWRISLDQGWRPEITGLVSHHASGENYARRIVTSDMFIDLAVSLGLAELGG